MLVPFAQLDLQGADATFHSLVLQVDSGAAVSLLARSIGELLGLPIEAGKRLDLANVGGRTTTAFLHTVVTRFADGIQYPVRYAVSLARHVPNLLGRLDVFDRLQVDLDPTLLETNIRAPWLDPGDRAIYESVLACEHHILERMEGSTLPQSSLEAVACFVNRLAQLYVGMLALLKLHRCYSGALYMRSMFELLVQLQYLLQDPETRARQYEEFTHVTRYQACMAAIKNPRGPVARAIASSPLRAQGEPRLRAEFERVRPMFETNGRRKTTLQRNWFGMDIRQLAGRLRLEGEYDVIYTRCSAWAHGDPSLAHTNADHWTSEPRLLFMICTSFYARMLLAISSTGSIELPAAHRKVLEALGVEWS